MVLAGTPSDAFEEKEQRLEEILEEFKSRPLDADGKYLVPMYKSILLIEVMVSMIIQSQDHQLFYKAQEEAERKFKQVEEGE